MSARPLSAITGLMHRSNRRSYLITSSASASSVCGHGQPEGLGWGFEVDDEPEMRRLFDWYVGGPSNWTYSITSSVRVSPNQEKQT